LWAKIATLCQIFKGMDYWKCIQLFGLIFVLKLRSNALALYWKTNCFKQRFGLILFSQ
jgi:hypothetical protein